MKYYPRRAPQAPPRALYRRAVSIPLYPFTPTNLLDTHVATNFILEPAPLKLTAPEAQVGEGKRYTVIRVRLVVPHHVFVHVPRAEHPAAFEAHPVFRFVLARAAV